MKIGKRIISPAELAGMIILAAAALFFLIDPLLSIALAFLYIILCFTASFCPETNFLGPAISRGKTGSRLVALTFDDGPTRPVTGQILDILDKYSAPATFFVTGVNAARMPAMVKEIIARGHSIGNHSFSHDPLLMLKRSRVIYQEIDKAREILQKIGVHTLAFRPPVGIVNPRLFPLLEKLNMYCLNFSCRAFDAGNRRVRGISRRILKKVTADDIILLHDVPPKREEDREILLEEIENLLSGLKNKGLEVVPLSLLIGKSIMIERD